MKIAYKLGLKDEIFARMVVKTKMLFSNVIGHAAELHVTIHFVQVLTEHLLIDQYFL